MKTYLGIDVGSVSTKLALIDEKNNVLKTLYHRTGGDPIKAIQRGLKQLKEEVSGNSNEIEVVGVGTTGSARYLAGVITGADLVKNEISAHARGASFFIPDVRTVIEIGGQDSKIIILENGVVVDFAMNLICLKGDTKITTNPGYTSTPIKEIKIGQKVLTHQGRFKPVEQVFERRYQGQMIKIETSNLNKLEVTSNHKILGIKKTDKKSELRFIEAQDFREGDFIASFKNKEPKQILTKIKKIEKYNFDGMVYNLKVKDDESYVANFFILANCAAGTGSFLDAQAFRLGIPIEKFGEIALKSKEPTVISSRCTVFAESDMIHKQQIGHSREDIIAGLCHGLARNFIASVAKGKKILPPIIFLGGVSENLGMRKAFADVLGQEIIVPKYNTVLGAIGVALLVKENIQGKTKFRGWEVSDQNIKCTSFQCKGCPNLCEVIEARIEGKVVSRWNDRCGKFSALNPNTN